MGMFLGKETGVIMNIKQQDMEAQLLNLVIVFLKEFEAERALQALTIRASLEKDLGIDSLGKVELFRRIEHHFLVRLPESTMTQAESLQDIIRIISQAERIEGKTDAKQTLSPLLETISVDISHSLTFIDVLQTYAKQVPSRPHIYFQNERKEEQLINYGQLYAEAKKVAQTLINHGIQRGESIAIMLPTCDTFFYSFIGILLIGAIPVPLYPPVRPNQLEDYAKRAVKILQNAEARILITFSQAKRLSQILKNFVPSLKAVLTKKDFENTEVMTKEFITSPEEIALIQYTSGSTGDPKGVTLLHQNIFANVQSISESLPIQPTDVGISWLPLYHDMGLMNWLGALYSGVPTTILSPITFLTRPEQWLWAIHCHRGTISGGPNFAYELCVNKINPRDIEGLDLSSWRFAFSGAEAVNPKTLDRFAKKFEPYGFQIESFSPLYGLAEATVGLTFPGARRKPPIDRIDRHALETVGEASPVQAGDGKNILEIVGCGIPMPGYDLRITDDNQKELPERHLGNIQFKGPSAMQGYYNNPVATQKAFHDGWWDTGDLGYLVGKEIFITGRKKDLIIKAGQNIFPEEIEEVVAHVEGIRKGCAVAFGIHEQKMGTEKLIVVIEIYDKAEYAKQKIRADIIKEMVATLGITPDEIVLVSPRTVPKTSSGKLQRSACKALYLHGKLKKYKLPVTLQMIKLTLKSAYKKMSGWIARFAKLIYTFYLAVVLFVTFSFGWLITLFSSKKYSKKIFHFLSRLFFRLVFCPIRITEKNKNKKDKAMVYVMNHASYADSLLAIAVLPAGTTFVVKKEVLENFILKSFLKRLSYIAVDRTDFSKSLEIKNEVSKTLQQGNSVVIFPEGTFSYATGLRPFRLGAFSVSVETGMPICPVAVNGMRRILRGVEKLVRPGLIQVTIGDPIYPQSHDWNEVVRLHGLVRAEIAKHCGEPVIDLVSVGPAVL